MTEEIIAESVDDITAAMDVEYVVVEGFTKTTRLQMGSLTAGDLIDFADENDGASKKMSLVRLLSRSIVNSKGERFLNNPQGVELLRSKAHKTIERLAKVAMTLNGIVLKNVDGKKQEDQAKNV
jgi:hypothetical protein